MIHKSMLSFEELEAFFLFCSAMTNIMINNFKSTTNEVVDESKLGKCLQFGNKSTNFRVKGLWVLILKV